VSGSGPRGSVNKVILGAEVVNDLLLLLVDPARKDDEQQLPRLKDKSDDTLSYWLLPVQQKIRFRLQCAPPRRMLPKPSVKSL